MPITPDKILDMLHLDEDKLLKEVFAKTDEALKTQYTGMAGCQIKVRPFPSKRWRERFWLRYWNAYYHAGWHISYCEPLEEVTLEAISLPDKTPKENK